MNSPTNKTGSAATRGTAPQATATARASGRRRRVLWGIGALVLVLAVGGLYVVFDRANNSESAYPFAVGQPGPGKSAPPFALPSSAGGNVSLPGLRGKTVLLFFQEGLTCQPCWDQIKDLEKVSAEVNEAGVDQVVSITSDPADLIKRKTRDMALTTPVLSDPGLAVSRAYRANDYGMMGTSRDGHSFVLVGPDGTIRWRADYGGAPKYTMYVPPARLLADLRAGKTS
ncbi:peroxiredoxin family protein [Streptomyces caniferus]|uniref:peroxiredoxin family protein n=1 Tax=Streptomyces caniferus TaxID=285557 RepID=UPI002E29E58E|nr:peroxiredoxin family protein [Streptomyces caniferus]